MQELGDKVPADDKVKIEGFMSELKDAISKEDHDKIKSTMTELQQAFYSVSESLYQGAAASEQGEPDAGTPSDSGTSQSSGGDDDVIDAEFSESK